MSLNKGLPLTRQMPSPPLPGCCCASNPMALITSWANGAVSGGRFNATNIDGVEAQALHLPCMDMPDMMDVAIVFKPTPDKYAVICLAKRASPDTLMGPDTVYDATVDAGYEGEDVPDPDSPIKFQFSWRKLWRVRACESN